MRLLVCTAVLAWIVATPRARACQCFKDDFREAVRVADFDRVETERAYDERREAEPTPLSGRLLEAGARGGR